MASDLPQKIIDQMQKAGLPATGQIPFKPRLVINQRGDSQIEKRAVQEGPKKGKKGYVDEQGRIWIKDRSHAGLPDHWDVQLNEGDDYFRVDFNENPIA